MELFTLKYRKLGMIVFLIMFNVAMSLPLKKAVAQSVLIDLPEFIHCTCDSGTFCLTDNDVMKLHAWHENIKHLENRRLFIVEQADVVPGD